MHRVVVQASVLMSGTVNTSSVDLRYIDNCSFEYIASAVSSPVGSQIVLQGSNDDTNWVTVGEAVTIDGTGSFMVADSEISYKYARAQYTQTSGSVTASVMFAGSEKAR